MIQALVGRLRKVLTCNSLLATGTRYGAILKDIPCCAIVGLSPHVSVWATFAPEDFKLPFLLCVIPRDTSVSDDPFVYIDTCDIDVPTHLLVKLISFSITFTS